MSRWGYGETCREPNPTKCAKSQFFFLFFSKYVTNLDLRDGHDKIRPDNFIGVSVSLNRTHYSVLSIYSVRRQQGFCPPLLYDKNLFCLHARNSTAPRMLLCCTTCANRREPNIEEKYDLSDV